MNAKKDFLLLLVLTLAVLLAGRTHAANKAATKAPIVMVCHHGTVKSLIAALLFDQEAKARGLPFRAISRGVTPDEEVPGKIASALEADGFKISDFEPQELSNRDLDKASHVIAIGVDLSAFQGGATATILQWNDIPPASSDYAAARRSLLAHIRVLLDELEEPPHNN